MLERIKSYWAIASVILIAALVFMLQRNKERYSDIQAELLKKKYGEDLDKAKEKHGETSKEYITALKRYQSILDSYNRRSKDPNL